MLRLLILLIAGFAAATSAVADPLPRSVLIVSQWDSDLPFSIGVSSAFKATLSATPQMLVSIYSEALDLSRFNAPKYQENFRRYLKGKYGDKNLSVIVAVGPLALEFMLRARSELSPTAPIVFGVVDEPTIAKLKLPSDVTGTTQHYNLHNMVAIAQAVAPKLQHVVLVGEKEESTSSYRYFKEERSDFPALEFIDLLGLPFAEVKKRVAALPENTVILYTAIFVDGAGIAFNPTLALKAIAEVANRPIVINTETQLGHGAVGGLLFRPNLFGSDAAKLTLRVLNGESAANIPIVPGNYAKPMFDWRQLTRWNISESQLPPGSELKFRAPGIWEQYRWYVIIALVIITLLVALITWLLVERRRRRGVEASLRLRLAEVVHLNRSATAGALSASVAHELNQPLGAILSSAEAGELYLNANPPNIERVKTILSNIRRDDQHAADIIVHLRGLFKRNSGNVLQELDLNDAINEAIEFIGPEAIKKRVALNKNFVPRPISVRADKVQLQQVIMNLAINGMDAIQNGSAGTGKLSIETALNGRSTIEVSVSDSGTGIPVGMMNKVFDAFYTTKGNGTGLGLSISRTIIENFGGRIWAENRPEGGAVFRFTLPLSNKLTP